MYDPSMLLWIDESGCDRCHSMRKRAYAIRGKPPRDHRIYPVELAIWQFLSCLWRVSMMFLY